MSDADSKRKNAKKSILWATLWLTGALWLQFNIGNPLAPLPLIWRGQFTDGKLVDVVEMEVEDERGRVGSAETYVYSYTVNGKVFQTAYDLGNLGATQKIKYLPENPSIGRIEGIGWRHRASSQVLRSALSNTGILIIPLYIAYVFGSAGIRDLRKNSL